ncbi:glycosyltransferase family 39 protein [Patescibacteria group bacterium]|nr:glycosyltransferase family 39 protein [Patescibacteria group bacterium]MCL5091453.1 glycosyltransferase family 39 protein [Patescibacteria group bacterium]
MFDVFQLFHQIKKRFARRDVLLGFVLVCVYLTTRLINLDKFPIFADEGIYIRWATTAWHDASWRFISLTDGRQPLQTWGTIPFLKLFPNQALLAGRLFATTTGLVGLVGMFTLCYYLFGKKAAYWGSLFYIFTPYFLFYDRMALMDSGVNAAFIWILFFSIVLVRTVRFDVALIFGMVAGLALLAKSSVELFIGLSIFAPLLVVNGKGKPALKKITNFLILFFLVVALATVIYNVQRLSPYMHFITLKNATFVKSLAVFVKNPLDGVVYHLQAIPEYILIESGYLLPFIGLAGLILLIEKQRRLGLYLLIWLILSYLIIALFSIVLYPRYVNFIAALLTISAGYLMTKVNRKIAAVLIAAYVFAVAYFDYTIVVDFSHIPFPAIDRGQYISGGSAGWGARAAVDYARQQAQTKPVLILAQGDFGMAADVLRAFVRPGDNVEIKGFWPLDKAILTNYQKELSEKKIFVVYVYQNSYPPDLPLTLIKRYPKPGGAVSLDLFALTP